VLNRRWLSVEWSREPGFIVEFDIEVRAKGVMDGGVATVRVAKVRSIDGLTWSDYGRKKVQVFGMIGASCAVRFIERANGVGALMRDSDNLEGASCLIGQFGDSTISSIALDGDAGGDNVANLEECLIAMGVDTLAMIGASIVGEDFENFSGKCSLVLGKAEKIVNGKEITKNRFGLVVNGEVERELEFAAKGSDGAENISAIDGAAVPGVSCA